MLNYHLIRSVQAATEPFRYFAVPQALPETALCRVQADFPVIRNAGIFPLSELSYGPAFAELIEEIRSPELEEILSEKFDIDLSGKPIMITVRGRCRASDGKIHTDTESKVVTCLLYLNEPWEESGGRLRLLRNPDDIDDAIVEIPPNGGTLVAFRRSDNSYHGHRPYEGRRRYIMFNWIASEAAMNRELARHRMSAALKRLNPFS
ncbi:hypothetical protein GGD81_002592 [Rhodobium orientis]|uniref:Fe2OG dioxygenase domain-containing protein n=1 Tax=Rhodobium orientis TaxID=34017 RepID=A0A327JYZ1_9HYPH|nr:2OG-Fe(II) oxygenase [Rhodobium orientis]MBB4303549.1 hypothetical protein [Rhodobium orientis]MBK5950478.1 hypothetical protein [Rhodobium orientis]RAI28308.1 hypothetical protein CH339_06680 [Rhodobium orientis]